MQAVTTPPTIEADSSPPSHMRAVVQREYGDADTLRVEDVPRPAVAPDEVLIEVRAAGLDRGTLHLMTGLPRLVRIAGFGLRRPKNPVPGLDVSGVVSQIGESVTRFRPGDEVFGIGRGSFAEFAAAREDKLALKPEGLSFEHAAVTAVSGLTALQGLTDVGRLEAGDRVLIVGASGGVGSFAVQIAHALGAEVTGMAGAAKLDLVRSLGADIAIDHAAQHVDAVPQRYDLILDVGGNNRLSRLRRALAPAGTLVIVGGEGGGAWIGGVDRQLRAMLLSRFIPQRLTSFISKEDEGLDRLAAMIEAGDITPALDRMFPLDRAAEAVRHLASGAARGKVAITTDSQAGA